MYSVSNEPDPYPYSGSSANSSSPPEISLARPLVALLADPPEPFNPKCKLGGAASTTTAAIATSAPVTYAVARASQRYAASTASPSSSAAMLDCEKLVISPANSQASTPAPISTSRRRRLHNTIVVTAIIMIARNRP